MRDTENRNRFQRFDPASAGPNTDPAGGTSETRLEEAPPLGPRKSRKKYTWKRYTSRRPKRPVHPDGDSPGPAASGEGGVTIGDSASKEMPDDIRLPNSRKSAQSGEAAAVLLSILLCMAALTGAHWWSVAAPASANLKLLWLASWVPGGLRIGPYAGKEIAACLVWLVTWGLLHSLLRGRVVSLERWLYGFIAAVLLMLVLLWPPIYHAMFGWPA